MMLSIQLRAELWVRQGWLAHPEPFERFSETDPFLAVERSQQSNPKVQSLILGDSVGRIAYSMKTNSDQIYSLCALAPVTLVGHYVLLHNWIEANPGCHPRVVLITVPFALGADLDDRLCYQCFLKPFNTAQNQVLFDAELQRSIEHVAFSEYCQFPPLLVSDWAPVFFLGEQGKKNAPFCIADTNLRYLKKIVELCRENHLEFVFSPALLSDKYKGTRTYLLRYKAHTLGLDREMDEYISKITYLPRGLFPDDIHPSQEVFGKDWLHLGDR